MRQPFLFCFALLISLIFIPFIGAQSPPAPPPASPQSPSPPQASTLAQQPGTQLISLDDAIQLALQHNHNLLAREP